VLARASIRAGAAYGLAVIPVTFAALLLGDFVAVALDTLAPASQPWIRIVLSLAALVVPALAVFTFLAVRSRQRGRFWPGLGPHFLRAGPLYTLVILIVIYYAIAHTAPDFWMVRPFLVVTGLVAVTGVAVDAVFAARTRTTISASAA
jgi:hypothetical protein